MSLSPGLVKRSNRLSVLMKLGVGIVLGIAVVVLELIDHYQPGKSYFSDVHFIREVVLYGFLFPTIGITIITLLDRANAERRSAANLLKIRESFAKRINETAGWEQKNKVIVQFPQTVLPVIGTALLTYNSNSNRMEVAAEWRADGVTSTPSTLTILDTCFNCSIHELPVLGKLVPCDYIVNDQVLKNCMRYCLPITHSGRRLGILYLNFLPEYKLSREEAQMMNGITPTITMAIERAWLEQSAMQQAAINEVDQQHIAQEMHDTLAQNIAYLRLKLDQFSTDHALSDIQQIRQDLDKMRGIADEAYQQVRGTLDMLHLSPVKEFQELLQEQIQRVLEISPSNIEFICSGQPQQLSPNVKRQAFFICKEALSNATSHSGAKRILVSITWATNELIVNISDDGCGFDPRADFEGHYGLSIMRDRALDIDSKLDINSTVNTGTQVLLRVPVVSVQAIGWPQCLPTNIDNPQLVDSKLSSQDIV